MITLRFALDASDFHNYYVFANNEQHEINAEENSFVIDSNQETHIKISYKQLPLTFKKIFGALFASLLQIPFFLLFDLTPDNKWYKDVSLYDFEYLFKLQVPSDEMDEIQFQIYNTNQNVSVSEIKCLDHPLTQLVDKKLYKNYTDLTYALLKYIFRVTWLELLLYIIMFLCFHNNCIVITVIFVIMIALYIVITVLAVRKYNKIKTWCCE